MPLAGEKVRASDVPGNWVSYTPVWSGSGSNPALGNGTIVGKYCQVGSLVFMRAVVTMGSTTTYGSGAWSITLPVTPVIDSLLTTVCQDSSAAQRYAGGIHIITSSSSGDIFRSSATTAINISPANPFTWTTSDKWIISGCYEAA